VQTVYVDSNANGALDTIERRTTSSATGNYSFPGLAAGTYNVTRLMNAGQKLTNPTSTAGAGLRAITVARGQIVSSVNLGVKPATSVVVTPPVTPVATFGVTGISLTTANGATLGTYSSNATIRLTSLTTRNVAIVANTTTGVRSVKMTGLGKTVTENYAPFALLGGGIWYAPVGTYTSTATGYSGLNLSGTQGKSVSVTLTFI